ncbi:uncharacterized protein LOC106663119 [Cimex lectularius]|uniref:Uncharacterized protein n=1 Tax=Cimex lectularius TaxID=79782 RepID=A0A8I6RDI4_CIMLE|nr:uncharacterized protein LOC106663119 [Cimex lectularius]XP_014243200.1 uncharacterized protein LOC106663119 [Cimex lectularius]XP_014243207.1 uncharacterized protein LOC106663119 [Cimex lectularius]XP_024083936.1 uncharacterized protein LOC106663119 [Cimex lectularius]XP_024083941.1 uncharacterized protein LOC106663119 [Cimex lectularius]
MASGDNFPRTPSPFVSRRPACLPKDPRTRRLRFSESYLKEVEKINEEYYSTWTGNDFCQDNAQNDLNESGKFIKPFHPLRKCFDPDATFCKFRENTLWFSPNSFLFKISRCDFYSRVISDELAIEENTEEAKLIFLLCSVVKDSDLCYGLFNTVRNFILPFKVFKKIIKNWGFRKFEQVNWKPNDRYCNIELSKTNLCYVLKLLTHSVESYNFDCLYRTVYYLTCLTFDPMCVGLSQELIAPLTLSVKILKEEFSVDDADLLEKLELGDTPIAAALIYASLLATDRSLYPIACKCAVASFCQLFKFKCQLKRNNVSVKLLLKLLTDAENLFLQMDIKDICDSLALLSFVMVRLKIEKKSKIIIKKIIALLSRIKAKLSSHPAYSVFLETGNRFSSVCLFKISPFLNNEEHISPSLYFV